MAAKGWEEERVKAALTGDREAFGELFERYLHAIVALVKGRFSHFGKETVEDVVGDTWLEAYENLGNLREPAKFHSWVFGIAVNVARRGSEALRRERTLEERLARRVDREWQAKAAKDAINALGTCPSPENPSECLVWVEAVANLPDPLNEIVLLKFFAGLSCKEIGNKLGKTPWEMSRLLDEAYRLLAPSLSGHPSRIGQQDEETDERAV